MDIMTVVGLLAGIATVYYVMADGNILHLLVNPVAFVLVFGGTFSATLIAYPWSSIKRVFPSLKRMFISHKHTEQDRQDLIDHLAELAEKAKRSEVQSLQAESASEKDEFLAYGLQMLVDGLEHDVIRDNLRKKLLFLSQHQNKVNSVFNTMATLSPIFGLLGTLIGVVQVLRNLSDPSSMGAAMAIAITTTFYGIFAANFLFLPASIKLTEQAESETLRLQMVAEGVLCIHQGDLPMMLRKKLTAFMLSSVETRSPRAR